MRSGLKSFVKVMDLASTQISSVEFRDTGGTVIPCNYFSVQCRNVSAASDDEHGFFFVAPSSNSTTIYGTNVLASATSETGAGAGGLAGTADATVEMSLLPPDRVTGITVSNSLGSKGRFIVTYGNIQPVNPLRDSRTDLYPRGS